MTYGYIRVSKDELANMWSQFATTYQQQYDNEHIDFFISHLPNEKRTATALPYAFTEQGVAMLSSVLINEIEFEETETKNESNKRDKLWMRVYS